VDFLHATDQITEMTSQLDKFIREAGYKKEFKQFIEIDHRKNLSFEEFYNEYALNSIPVIISDAAWLLTKKNWTDEYLKKICGNNPTIVKKWYSHITADKFGGLQTEIQTTVAKFIDSQRDQKLYMHDFSIPKNCPRLLEDFVVTKYSSGDFLMKIDQYDNVYRNVWPSLFYGQKDSRTGLHEDSYHSDFWMGLFEGKKQWNFVLYEDRPFIYQIRNHGSASSMVDLSNPDFDRFPLLSKVTVYQGIQESGEILFAPGKLPHQVINLETSKSVGMNYVSGPNFILFKEYLERNARAGMDLDQDCLNAISSTSFNNEMNMNPKDLEWKDFINQQIQ